MLAIKGAPTDHDTQTTALLSGSQVELCLDLSCFSRLVNYGFTRVKGCLLSALVTQMWPSYLAVRELLSGSQKIKFSNLLTFNLVKVSSGTTSYCITDVTKSWFICRYSCIEILVRWNLIADKVNHFGKTTLLAFFYVTVKWTETTVIYSNRYIAEGLKLKMKL